MRRILAMILVISMVLTMLPVKTYASETNSDWSLESTIENPVFVSCGDTATIGVSVVDGEGEEFTYQWYKIEEDGMRLLEGEDGPTYTTGQVYEKESYYCYVTDSRNQTQSLDFQVRIDSGLKVEIVDNGNIEIENLFGYVSAEYDTSVTLGVKASVGLESKLEYQWYVLEDAAFVPIEDAKEDSFTLVATENGAEYYCEVTDDYGEVLTANFIINIDSGLHAEAVEETISVTKGEDVRLEVFASAYEGVELKYEWYRYEEDGSVDEAIEGANDAVYMVEDVRKAENYFCKVSDSFGNETRVQFYVRISATWEVCRINEGSITVPMHEDAIMSVQVSNAEDYELTYQWSYIHEVNEVEIEGANEETYTAENVVSYTCYYCKVTDEYGNSESVSFDVNPELNWSVEAQGNDTIYVGLNDSATMTVQVEGLDEEDVTYQWYVYDEEEGYVRIEGANNLIYTVEDVTRKREYYCEVRDQYGNIGGVYFVISIEAKWYAEAEDGEEKAIALNEDVRMDVVTDAPTDMNFTYQWYQYDEEEGATLIEGANGPGYTVEDVTRRSEYYCQVKDQYGNSQDVWFYISILADWSLEAVGETEVAVFKNETTTLEVRVDTKEDIGFTYKWFKYGPEIDDVLVKEGSTQLITEPVTEKMWYQCIVEDQYGNAQMVYFDVMVDYGWTAEAKDGNERCVSVNDKATLEVDVRCEDEREFEYVWYAEDSNGEAQVIPGENSSTYETEPISYLRYYYCDVTDMSTGDTVRVWFNVYIEHSWQVDIPGKVELTVAEYDTPTLSLSVDNGEKTFLNYTWYRWNHYNYEVVEDVEGPELVTESITRNTEYYCLVSDDYGNECYIYFYINIDPDKEHTHIYGEFKVTKEATCKEAGTKVKTCAGCGDEQQEEIPVTNEHTYGEFKVTKEATCKEAGTKVKTCTVCGKQNSEIIPVIGTHTYGEWKVVKEATCDKEGSQERYCTVCNNKETSAIKAKGYVKDEIFTSGKYSYKIKTQKGKKGTVVCVGSTKVLKSVTIPKSVRAGGITFTVVEIAKGAFKNNSKLSSVVIGAEITKIGSEAFSGCKKLKKITIKSSKLKSVGKNAIKGINKKTTIKVPAKKLSKYKKMFKSSTGYKKTMQIKK